MPKDKKLDTPDEATITETSKPIKLITDPEQVKRGLLGYLNYQGRQILVVRGHDTAQVIAQVYFKFAAEEDSAGQHFQLSIAKRGLTHTSPIWKTPTKITGAEMLDYLNRWFVAAELRTNANGPGLLLLDGGIPATFAGMCMQPRYLAMFANLFTSIDHESQILAAARGR